jgi:hypothetical protein
MALVDRRRVSASSAVVLVALLVGSGATIGSDADGGLFDPVTFAKGIEDHFRIEYGAEMVGPVAFDPVTFAKGIEDHFWIEYGAEYGD